MHRIPLIIFVLYTTHKKTRKGIRLNFRTRRELGKKFGINKMRNFAIIISIFDVDLAVILIYLLNFICKDFVYIKGKICLAGINRFFGIFLIMARGMLSVKNIKWFWDGAKHVRLNHILHWNKRRTDAEIYLFFLSFLTSKFYIILQK